MATTIRQRSGDGWITTTLLPATLTRDVWATTIHGKTGQEIARGWLDAGERVYVREAGQHTPNAHPFWAKGDPTPTDEVYDEGGMLHRISCGDWSALQFEADA